MEVSMCRINIVIACVVLLFAIFIWAAPSIGEMKSVCFRNNVTDRVKTPCIRIQGKNNYYPTYECWDNEKSKYVSFSPGDEWKELTGKDCVPTSSVGTERPVIPKGMGDGEDDQEGISKDKGEDK